MQLKNIYTKRDQLLKKKKKKKEEKADMKKQTLTK